MQAGHSEVCPLTGDEDDGQPRVYVSEAPPAVDEPAGLSRPVSATSSLDPYYFGAQTPSDSPPPPLPQLHPPALPSVSSGVHTPNHPLTPARDPANIDRMGLVGVGELTTPRWDKIHRRSRQSNQSQDEDCLLEEEDAAAVMVAENLENDAPDSPWTIEAVDGESDDKDEVKRVYPRRNFFSPTHFLCCSIISNNLPHVPSAPVALLQTRAAEKKSCTPANHTGPSFYIRRTQLSLPRLLPRNLHRRSCPPSRASMPWSAMRPPHHPLQAHSPHSARHESAPRTSLR